MSGASDSCKSLRNRAPTPEPRIATTVENREHHDHIVLRNDQEYDAIGETSNQSATCLSLHDWVGLRVGMNAMNICSSYQAAAVARSA